MPFEFSKAVNIGDWLQFCSRLSTPVIAVLAVLHLIFFMMLKGWYTRDLRAIVGTLDDYTRGLKFRSVLDRSGSLTTQIDAFVQDVNDVLNDTSRKDDRAECLRRLHILDEKRRYLESLSFETAAHAARVMIEAYPLAGVLGTVLAIGSALQADAVSRTVAASDSISTVNVVMERFGDSIWSTFTGLSAAIILMFLNSVLEIRFQRLTDSRIHVREMVAHAKRELGLSAQPIAEAPRC